MDLMHYGLLITGIKGKGQPLEHLASLMELYIPVAEVAEEHVLLLVVQLVALEALEEGHQ